MFFIEPTIKEDIRYGVTSIIPYQNMLTTFNIIQVKKKLLEQTPNRQLSVKKAKTIDL
jgi:hypothetical protein